MTSKNSFWDSSRENHKRRIWVWIVVVLSQLLVYGGTTMIYLSRIKSMNAEGVYRTQQQFWEEMYQAAKDALGFSDNLQGIIFLLAAMIAMQGFSYLYDRRKVDMYHGVPVSKNKRFAVIYVNGLIIWVAANLSGLLVGTVIAVSQKAVNADVMAAAGLAFIWNLFYFLVFYNAMILTVMLTGNRFVTIFLFLTFSLYETSVFDLMNSLKSRFFETYSIFFTQAEPKLSALYDYADNILTIKWKSDAAAMAKIAMPIAGKWLLISAALLALAFWAYKKRPSETAGKAVTWEWLKPVIKVFIVIPVALMIGMLVSDTSYSNELLQVIGMLAGGAILCGALEVLYDFDIRSIFRHWISTIVTFAGILAVFCIFKWDLFGYDSYIPAQNKVESIAISVDGYYDSYWEYEEDGRRNVGSGEYFKEHMFLTDVEPVLELAKTWQPKEATQPARNVQVLYRLKSGAWKERTFWVDLDDEEAQAQFDRIFRTDVFKQSVFPMLSDERADENVSKITYRNGAAEVAVPAEEAAKIREAWIRDMEQFDFSMARHNRPEGTLTFAYTIQATDVYSYNMERSIFVYDSFANTIDCLKAQGAWYPMELDAADIDSISVTCYHNELTDPEAPEYIWGDGAATAEAVSADAYVDYGDYSVKETFYDEEEIAQILPHIYSTWIDVPWENYSRDMDDNYSIEVTFKRDSAYPYDRTSYYFSYDFLKGQVPDFVKEATAFEP